MARKGDSYATIEGFFGITDPQFYERNPAISSDCVDGFWADEAYYVGVAVPGSRTPTVTSISSFGPPYTNGIYAGWAASEL